ncbi:MAG TPA: hypothetical protein VIK97_07965, partial [Casimicrobiaceae bacterium]
MSGDEFVAASQEIAADPDFDTLRFIVVDFSGVKEHTIDEATLQDVAVIRIGSMATNPNVRIAMVTTDHGFAMLTQSANVDPFVGTHEVKVFATVALWRASGCSNSRLWSRAVVWHSPSAVPIA